MPVEVENLIKIAKIKNLCKKLNIERIYNKNDIVVFSFNRGNMDIDVQNIVKHYRNRIKFSDGIKPSVSLTTNVTTDEKLLNEIQDFLKILINWKL